MAAGFVHRRRLGSPRTQDIAALNDKASIMQSFGSGKLLERRHDDYLSSARVSHRD